jgi:hypothetical protein
MAMLFVALGMVVFGGGLYLHQVAAQQGPADKSPAAGETNEKKGEPPQKQEQAKPTSELLYELHVQVLIGVTEIKKFSMTLPMNVPGKVRIIDGGVVLDAGNRDRLGIFLRATVVGENVKGVLTELALDDIGLVEGKADIQRLYKDKQLGKVQGFSVDSKSLPGQLTINLTVQRLGAPGAPKDGGGDPGGGAPNNPQPRTEDDNNPGPNRGKEGGGAAPPTKAKPYKIRVYIEKVNADSRSITASCMTIGQVADVLKPLRFENLQVSGKAKITDRGKEVKLADLKLDTGFYLFLEAHEFGFEVVGIETIRK